MPQKEAPQWQAAAASGSVYAGTLDKSDNNTAHLNLQLLRLPPGLDLARHRIIAAHFFGAITVGVAS